MKILGIDTTTKYLGLAFYDGAKIYVCDLDLGIRHAELLMGTVDHALSALGWGLEEIDYFACGLGPGSFTGVRIGLSAIKGFSWALHKPVVGFSSLDILAMNASAYHGANIVTAVDAKRSLIYSASFKNNNGVLKITGSYRLSSEKEFLKNIKPDSLILGDASGIYKESILKNIKGAQVLDKDYWFPKGHNIILKALERISEKSKDDLFTIEPIYLYPKECQIRKGK